MELSPIRDAPIQKHTLLFRTHFWVHFGIENGGNLFPKCFQKSIKKEMRISHQTNPPKWVHQEVEGGSSEPALHSQNSVWDPLGTLDGARAPLEVPLDDF